MPLRALCIHKPVRSALPNSLSSLAHLNFFPASRAGKYRIVHKSNSSPLHRQCRHEFAYSGSHAQRKGVYQSLNTLAARIDVLAGPTPAMAKLIDEYHTSCTPVLQRLAISNLASRGHLDTSTSRVPTGLSDGCTVIIPPGMLRSRMMPLSISSPFSRGPRQSLGTQLAWRETRLFIAKVLWSFDVEIASGQKRIDFDRDFKMYATWEKPEFRVRFHPVRRDE